MALLAIAAILLLLTVPGLLLVRALRRAPEPRSAARTIERLGLGVALSIGLLILVGTSLGHLHLYRFAATGAPVVEGVLLALLAGFGVLAFRGRVRARRAAPAEA